jgi:Co/Zn/Cd efflux system component
MRDSRWKLRTDQDGHLFIFAMIPLFLAALLPYIGIESLKEYITIGTTVLGVICCWMLIWISRRGKSIKLPKKIINLWMWVNAIMSVAVIITTIAIIFWGW